MSVSNLGSYCAGPLPAAFLIENDIVSQTTLANSVQLGTRLVFNGEEYVYCYNTGASSITAGYGATNTGCSGYSVTVTNSDESDLVIAFCKHTTAVTGAYFWGMTKGLVMATAINTLAAGIPITIGNSNGQVMTYASAAHSFPGDVLGRTIGSNNTATTGVLCYVKCYG